MEKIKEMSIDLETYSDVDIKKSGVYKYAESENFEILLFAVSINGDDVIVYDLACGDVLPDEILDAIVSDDVIKWAFNASFERICLSYWMKRNYPDRFCSYSIPEDTVGNYLNPASWRCTMIWSAYMGLPLSLEGVGTVLGLKDQKMKEGKDLIRYFCVPCKPTKSNGGRTRNLPMHAPEKWTVFKSYNKRDVEVEMGIKDKLHKFPVPDFVWEEYHLDQEINDRGILVDLQMVENAITFDERSKATIADEMRGLTDIDNPNSVSQMKSWLSDQGIEVESLGKKAIAEMIKDAPEDLAQVLSLRQQLAKSSVKKYQAMQNAACIDHRTRGMFQFYGANRTGRWAGRLIQLQNLPQNHMYDLDAARELVRIGDYDSLSMLYDDIPDTLSQLIRTAFIAKPGYKFYGIKFEVISAYVEGSEAKIFISVQDIDGDRIDETTDFFDSFSINTPFDCSSSCENISYDTETKTATFLISISQWNEKDIIGEKITFCVREMLSNKQEYDAILTDLDLTQISATPKTITPTQIWGGGGTNYNEMENNFQALKTTGILCSPIAEVDITAMGYVDGKLHIQVKYEDSLETDNHGYIYFKNDKGEEIHCIANIAFSTDSEHQERYVEYVYDLSDVDLTQYKVYGYFVTSDTHIEGNWSVTFPLESISQ